jgi:hypothetical protein
VSDALERVGLTLRTILNLRPEQILWRLRRSLMPRRVPDVCTGPVELAPGAAGVGTRWVHIEERTPDPELQERSRRILDGELFALGRSISLADVDWNGQPVSALWTYHLHYFESLPSLHFMARKGVPGATARIGELVEGWIKHTESGKGVGWDPYPTSVRIVQWLKVLAMEEAGEPLLPDDLRKRMLRSLCRQASHLARNLEWDLSANHLLKNLCAMVWVGSLLECPGQAREGTSWRRRLLREVERQVLPDGMHEERSPAYHQLVLHDLLEVRTLRVAMGDPQAGEMDRVLLSMLSALGRVTRPDGSFFLLGDSANGSAPPLERLQCFADPLVSPPAGREEGVWSLPHAGFYGYTDHRRRLVVDCGPIGPRHQPAHGHCDALSFELDIEGVPFIVDSGVHGYAGDPFREYSRSTRAHNTVMIDGREQSEVWGHFRVARMAVVERLDGPRGGEGDGEADLLFHFQGACAPYHDPDVRHLRRFALGSGTLTVLDEVRGGEGRGVESFLHLHPRWTLTMEGDHLRAGDGEREIRIETMGLDRVEVVRGRMDPVQGWYLPAMGESHASPVLVGCATVVPGHLFGFRLHWMG